MLSEINLEPGICPALLKCLEVTGAGFKEDQAKLITICFDEVALGESVKFNTKTKKSRGF